MVIDGGASGNRIGTDGNSVDDVGRAERHRGEQCHRWRSDISGTGTDGNIVAGNFIGTDVTGTIALGIAGRRATVSAIAEGASSNWIGVNPMGGTAVADEGNVISGNGLRASSLTARLITWWPGDKIGTDITGTKALGNGMIPTWRRPGRRSRCFEYHRRDISRGRQRHLGQWRVRRLDWRGRRLFR